jgi:glycosyltransferase involved in cell wall biosynthesis
MKNDFKIHCIALCKNEADVIEVCLREAVKWSDFIYVYDGGSTDGTWEIVQGLNDPRIIAWKQDGKVFKEGLRAEVFNAFRHQSGKGDWWFQLNVDEFYPESPRTFLARVPNGHDFVWGNMVEYVLTEKDVMEIDFSLPFEQNMSRLHYYYVSWSEPRAFRFRDGLQWDINCAWPRHVGAVAKERIIYKHYPCRSPRQLQARWATRKENRERGFEGWKEEGEAWRQTIKKSQDYLFDDGTSPLIIDESKLPRHLEKPVVRLLKHIFHRSGIWP